MPITTSVDVEMSEMPESSSYLDAAMLAPDEADALLAALEHSEAANALPQLPDPPGSPLRAFRASRGDSSSSSKVLTLSKRERERRELVALREDSKQLVQRLETLKATVSCGRRLSARQSIWRHIARRHLADRRRAERENARLRADLTKQFRFAQEFRSRADNCGDSEPAVSSSATTVRPPYALEDRDRVVLEQLVAELDLAYGLIDSVFDAKAPTDAVGSVDSSYYSIRKTQLLENEGGGENGHNLAWVELRDARVIPFDFQQVIDAVWRSWVVWHMGSTNINTGMWSSSRRYHGVDRPEHTLALKFRLRSVKPNQTPTFLHEKVTVRRYLNRDRLVLVWRCMSEGEQDYAGLSTDETEWVIVERAGLRGPGGGPEYAVIRSCVRLLPSCTASAASARDGRAFTNLVIKSYEDDANFALREMEAMLLRANQAAAASSK